jgi:PAS domain-containing protein
VTERKLAQEALSRSYESLHSTLNATRDGFLWPDRQGNLLDVNLTYSQQSGYLDLA